MEGTREERRRRGLRTAIRVAGLVGLVATGVAWRAETASAADQKDGANPAERAERAMHAPYGRGCCDFGGMWGPPAPARMKVDGLARLRSALS